ncbi:MAG TPA: TraR/DksA C4-type zinc finger protein [Chloroflexota bacterium]|jgi:RNA polymerase-binding transcription factor DksA|nr:TraR/DksA C4-type zinc finger protein [Chloroflexota bacterium]
MSEQEHPPAGAEAPGDEPISVGELLRRRAAEAEGIVQFIDQTTLGGDEEEAADELTTADQHPADTADVTFQRELDVTIRRMAAARQAQVAGALERQRQGTYGRCERCGRPIDPERLRVRPEAARCIDCQREQERAARR